MKYLVSGSEGPGFASPEEAVEILEEVILPTFDALMKLEAQKKIAAGGLPVGDRAFVFIAEAASNEELDRLLRSLRAGGSRTRCGETIQEETVAAGSLWVAHASYHAAALSGR